jgi:hypothetical protein
MRAIEISRPVDPDEDLDADELRAVVHFLGTPITVTVVGDDKPRLLAELRRLIDGWELAYTLRH